MGWFSYSPTSGYGDGLITVDVATLNGEDRVGRITAFNESEGLTASTNILQTNNLSGPIRSIEIRNLSWENDIPWYGGYADSGNCSFNVIARYNNQTTGDVTDYCTITGSVYVNPTNSSSRTSRGTLGLTAHYKYYTGSTEVEVVSSEATTTVYQEGNSVSNITNIQLTASWYEDVSSYGGVADYRNCICTVLLYLANGTVMDITSSANIEGELLVPRTTQTTRHSCGDLVLSVTDGIHTSTATVTGYQGGFNIEEYNRMKGEYLTFEIISGGTIKCTRNLDFEHAIEYSVNGADWVSGNSFTIDANKGDIIRFRGDNRYYHISNTRNGIFEQSTAYFNVFGNIMSMFYSTDFSGKTSFRELVPQSSYLNQPLAYFFYNTNVVDATMLVIPATTLPDTTDSDYAIGCYCGMFDSCRKLKYAPYILPATVLSPSCYEEMFFWCDKMVAVPIISALTLATECFYSMFVSCLNLVIGPEFLSEDYVTVHESGGQIWAEGPVHAFRETFVNCKSLKYVKIMTNVTGGYPDLFFTYEIFDYTGSFENLEYGKLYRNGNSVNPFNISIPRNWTYVDVI